VTVERATVAMAVVFVALVATETIPGAIMLGMLYAGAFAVASLPSVDRAPVDLARRPAQAPGVYVIRRSDMTGTHWKIGRSKDVARRWTTYERQIRAERTLSPHPVRIEFEGFVPVGRAGAEKRLERDLHARFKADRVTAKGAGRELFRRTPGGELDMWLTALGVAPDRAV